MSLVSRPVLDFELGGASTCLEILGLKELIRHLLLDQIEARFVSGTGQYRISEQVCGGGGGGGGGGGPVIISSPGMNPSPALGES